MSKKLVFFLAAFLFLLTAFTKSSPFQGIPDTTPIYTLRLSKIESLLLQKAEDYQMAKSELKPAIAKEILALQKEREDLGSKGKIYLWRFSNQGKQLLKRFEVDDGSDLLVYAEDGKTLTALLTYLDAKGVSVGYGHYVGRGENYDSERTRIQKKYGINASKSGELVPIKKAEDIFEEDILSFEEKLNLWLLRNNILVNQNQFDALLMYSYQQGKYIWDTEGTGSIVKYMEEHPNGASNPELAKEIQNMFSRNYKGVPFTRGLKNRHNNEAVLFLTGKYEKLY